MKKSDQKSPQEMMDYWAQSEVLTLGNHFHGLTKVQHHQECFDPDWRVSDMELSRRDIKRLEKKIKSNDIDSLSLCMALSKHTQKELNLAPLLCGYKKIGAENIQVYAAKLFSKPIQTSIKLKKNLSRLKRLSMEINSKSKVKLKRVQLRIQELQEQLDLLLEEPGSQQVPAEFLRTVSRNWSLLDPASVDDLFMADRSSKNTSKANRIKSLQRLTKYEMSAGTNSLLFNTVKELVANGNLGSFKMHFGVDLNKQPQQSDFTFTPVIELGTPRSLRDELMRLLGHLVGDDVSPNLDMPVILLNKNINSDGAGDSLLFEYIKPCPVC